MRVGSDDRSVMRFSPLQSYETDQADETQPTPVTTVTATIIHAVDALRRDVAWLLCRHDRTESEPQHEHNCQSAEYLSHVSSFHFPERYEREPRTQHPY
jgi:hypothetical protein